MDIKYANLINIHNQGPVLQIRFRNQVADNMILDVSGVAMTMENFEAMRDLMTHVIEQTAAAKPEGPAMEPAKSAKPN